MGGDHHPDNNRLLDYIGYYKYTCSTPLFSMFSSKAVHSSQNGKSYRIIRCLGHGSFGEVLLAEETCPPQAQYAIKQLYMQDHQQGLPLPLLREMSALQQLQHPNIVSLMDIATDGPCFYLIQELCSTDLAVLLQNTNRLVPQPVVKALMQQLLAALAACHARGIMHRDIKPSNILITSHGTLKLGDFGQARSFICGAELRQPDFVQQRLSSYVMMPRQHQAPLNKQPPVQEEQQHLQRKLQHMTDDPADPNPRGTPNICIDSNACNIAGSFTAAQGSRWYRAPELLYHSSSYGPEVDVWAAGMVLAEVLGLSPLLPGQSDIDQLALMQQVLGSITLQDWPEACQLPDWHKISFGFSPTQPLCQLLPDAPEAALDLLQQLLWYRPDKRLTAAEAVQHTWFTSHPPPASADEVAVYVQAVLKQPWPRLPSQDV